ncbi:MAG TPA: hypothetical protein VM737_00860 [Gemmatimonadota bacterium]|nr:hypothetical protein [Gemmatimonadota bacterium]
MSRARIRAGVPGLALFLLIGCGGAQSSPEGTVRSFLDALESRDTAAFQASFTDSTRQLVREIERLSRQAGGGSEEALTVEEWCRAFCGGTVEGTTLDGNAATVRVRVERTVEEMPLSRVGDRWKIDLAERLTPAVQMLRLAVSAAGVGRSDGILPDTAGTESNEEGGSLP